MVNFCGTHHTVYSSPRAFTPTTVHRVDSILKTVRIECKLNTFFAVVSLSYSLYHSPLLPPGNDITDANKAEKAKRLIEIGKQWNKDYGSKGHVLMTFGDDFQYQHAERWFSNLDKLIAEVNKNHHDVHLFYSSPHCYICSNRDNLW